MNEKQMQAAQAAMIEWLADENELGKAPAKIECASEFTLHEMRYYIFKYKRSLLGKWLLGVCGGYEGDETEHCGHVFSEMEPYDPATAQEQATAIVEMIRAHWMQRAEEELARRGLEPSDDPDEESDEEQEGPFVSFVLLEEPWWDRNAIVKALQTEWDIHDESENPEAADDQQSLVWECGGMMLAVSLMPGPVPDGEAERNAENNYLWPQAVEVTKRHQAHLLVAAIPKESSAIEAGKLLVKANATCLGLPGALGVYTSGTVFEPEFYRASAEMLREGELPIFNWIYFGLYRTEAGMNAYTYGMRLFARDEMEVLGADAEPTELRNFLYNLADYVLSSGVVLKDGETIGFSEEQKLPITRSKGESLDGQTLKIAYQAEE